MQFVLLNSIQVLVDVTLSLQIVYYKWYKKEAEDEELNEEKEIPESSAGDIKGRDHQNE